MASSNVSTHRRHHFSTRVVSSAFLLLLFIVNCFQPSNARIDVVVDGTAGVFISKLLLGDICAATEDPDFCTAVLSADPRTPYADLFGLASVSMNLAIINATDTQKCITEFYMIAYPDQTVQLQACSSDYQVIIANLKLVGNNLLDYGNSKVADKKLVEDVMHHITECENQFSSCHVIPSPLAGRNKIVTNLVNILDVVISRIP